MKQVDFEHGGVLQCILQSALPLLAAQVLNLLYNIVDRIYIARIPGIGTDAIGAVGLCFPVVSIIAAFTSLYGSGGAPLYSMAFGKGDLQRAGRLMNIAFRLEVITGTVLMVCGEIFCVPLLRLFGASSVTLPLAASYLRIFLLGTVFSMIAAGMNPFINAQGYPLIGMLTVTVGAVLNIALDPLFLFVFRMGVPGAALATILSQIVSACFVLRFLTSQGAMSRLTRFPWRALSKCGKEISAIISLGLTSFVMQFTNGLVSISCNSVLSRTGGDIYVSVMTIISSVRQLLDTPILAIADGSSPVISYNYGARRPGHVRRAIRVMTILGFSYTILTWVFILVRSDLVIGIFSSDREILKVASMSMHVYFSAFVFQTFQYAGQTTFKALGKSRKAIFFSLLRKVVIVVPLTFLLPYAFHMGPRGVFMAEPVSNVVGGLACYITMVLTVFPELKRMKADQLPGGASRRVNPKYTNRK